jgi:hypothetical protein
MEEESTPKIDYNGDNFNNTNNMKKVFPQKNNSQP